MQDKIEYALLLEEQLKRKKNNILNNSYKNFYEWQYRFTKATSNNFWCMLMAANQVGKSLTGCCIDAYHLLGNYPDDWNGYKFCHPIKAWLLGYSGEKTRDLLQKKLFGDFDNNGRKLQGGLIPPDRIKEFIRMPGTPGALRQVKVTHKNGISICQFWSYGQGQHALMGDAVDWVHIDEEPEDQEIFPQVLTRTINGNKGKGGRGILTFTPENGKTSLVTSFMDENKKGQYLQTATWDDSPHLTHEKKERLLNQYPSYQRDMRSKGIPLMGEGRIFDIDENLIKVEPFIIPENWYVINGLDFGWDHPQAISQLVWDKDSDIFYLTHAWKKAETQPFEAWHIVKSWAENVPTAWPVDGLKHEGSARQHISYYEDEGFLLLPESARWEDGSNGVWVGLVQLNNLMKTGRFKVFSNLIDFFEEFREYHTKNTHAGLKTQIVKKKDDILDSIRYAYMMKRYAIPFFDVIYTPEHFQENIYLNKNGRDPLTGY